MGGRSRIRRIGPRLAALTVLLVTLSGCASGYVLRAGYEEMRILWRRRPIAEVLAGGTAPDMRAKLELTLAVREFARDRLGLSVRGSYASVAQVDDDQVVHLVTAAPRTRLIPYTWWFPIVGRVPYRAYFDQHDAQSLAAGLERDGYDTYVRPAVAFSTLGWFDDPLLSSLLRFDEVSLAEIIVHELLHNTVYLPGQTAFDESFASFVGCRGAVEFFTARNDDRRVARARDLCADQLTFSRDLGDLVTRLESSYAAGIVGPERTALFEAAQVQFRSRPWRTDSYRDFGRDRLNNAVIVHHWLYAQRLDLFEQALASQGNDLARMIVWVTKTVRGASEPFTALAGALGAEATIALDVCPGSDARHLFRGQRIPQR